MDNLEELQSLHANRVQEGTTLEYKASAAVDNTDAKKLEISKDISAMANAEGGQFVYGMSEVNHTGWMKALVQSPLTGSGSSR